MNPRYKIYIISKGRAKNCLTARELSKMNVPYKIVVEPQEEKEYGDIWGYENLIITPFSNLGLGSIPVRNFVWDLSIKNGEKRHWLLDDNIEGFHRLNRNIKPKVTDGAIFRAIEDFVERYKNVPFAGMNYYSFCKTTDAVPPFYLNTRIYSCTLIDNSLNFRWRGKYNEDTDLSLRILKAGYCTILFNAFLIGKVTTQRMKGGNTDDIYANTNNRREFAESLQKQHPDVVKVVWKFNRWHHSVNYKPFKKNKLIRVDNYDEIVKQGINEYGMKLIDKKDLKKI